jgi:microcompartment protein CcmK/EutM
VTVTGAVGAGTARRVSVSQTGSARQTATQVLLQVGATVRLLRLAP